MTVVRWGGDLGADVVVEDDAGNITRTERRDPVSLAELKIDHDKAVAGEGTSRRVEVVRRGSR